MLVHAINVGGRRPFASRTLAAEWNFTFGTVTRVPNVKIGWAPAPGLSTPSSFHLAPCHLFHPFFASSHAPRCAASSHVSRSPWRPCLATFFRRARYHLRSCTCLATHSALLSNVFPTFCHLLRLPIPSPTCWPTFPINSLHFLSRGVD